MMTTDYLSHHGILGQKWGVRRFQNADGSLTSAGRKRYGSGESSGTTEMKGLGLAISANNDDEFRKELLETNPNAAIEEPNFFQRNKKKILIGAAIGASAVGIAYAAKTGKLPIASLMNNDLGRGKADDLLNGAFGEKKFSGKADDLLNGAFGEKNFSGEAGQLNGFDSKAEKYVAGWEHADQHRFDPISEAEFETMDNTPTILDAGSEMFRMSKNKHGDLREGIEYVSFGEDRDRYKGFLPQMWSAHGYTGEGFYEAALKSKEAIKAPGKKESILLMEKAVKVAYPYPFLTDADYHADTLQNFNRYSTGLIDRNSKLSAAYFKELEKAGYNAVVDYNDAGRLADKPLILLNGSKSASVSSVNSISRDQASQAFANIEPPKEYANFSAKDYESVVDYRKISARAYLK